MLIFHSSLLERPRVSQGQGQTDIKFKLETIYYLLSFCFKGFAIQIILNDIVCIE